MNGGYVIEADLTWTGERFRSGIQVAIGPDGRIADVGELGRSPDMRLRDEALLPGFVNVHSHAFQRALRGRGERFPIGTGSFWTWRAEMYSLVQRLGADEVYTVSRQAFREMLRSGITTVGEFHYVHHDREMDWSLDRIVLRAARDAGIRIVLLNTYYRTGGIGRPLEAAQRRFDGGSLTAYWEQMDTLAAELAPAQHLGVAAHSVRAVGPDEIAALHAEATRRGFVFHLHLEEQRQEIDECVAAFGRRPMALLAESIGTPSNVTAVHCTHTAAEDMHRFLAGGGMVCVCPLTEANLGDGIPDLTQVIAAENRLSLGTDSNARISMLEEMRWLEYAQRLRAERRGMLAPGDGNLARVLLETALQNGARALGIDAGRFVAGAFADFVAIDLTAPALDGCDEETLPAALVVGAGAGVVRRTCVGGHIEVVRG